MGSKWTQGMVQCAPHCLPYGYISSTVFIFIDHTQARHVQQSIKCLLLENKIFYLEIISREDALLQIRDGRTTKKLSTMGKESHVDKYRARGRCSRTKLGGSGHKTFERGHFSSFHNWLSRDP